MSFTPTQIAILVLLLVAGWLFGLASHPGGRKWKARYLAERDAHASLRTSGDARAVAAEARVAEVEREHARLVKAAPVTAATIMPSAAPVARPAYPAGERRGWFEFGDRRVR